MKKYVILFFSLFLLLSSCVTQGRGDYYTDEEKIDALRILTQDMIELSVEKGEIGEDVFIAMLPSSFTVYKDFSPVYSNLESSYASSLSEIFSPLLLSCYPLVENAIDEAITGGDLNAMVNNPEGMTDRLQELLAVEIYQNLLTEVELYSSEAENAAREALVIFSSIRTAYVNLYSVGSTTVLPVPEGLALDQIAFTIVDELFTRFGECERELKSRIPENSESPYSVFWEATL